MLAVRFTVAPSQQGRGYSGKRTYYSIQKVPDLNPSWPSSGGYLSSSNFSTIACLQYNRFSYVCNKLSVLKRYFKLSCTPLHCSTLYLVLLQLWQIAGDSIKWQSEESSPQFHRASWSLRYGYTTQLATKPTITAQAIQNHHCYCSQTVQALDKCLSAPPQPFNGFSVVTSSHVQQQIFRRSNQCALLGH